MGYDKRDTSDNIMDIEEICRRRMEEWSKIFYGHSRSVYNDSISIRVVVDEISIHPRMQTKIIQTILYFFFPRFIVLNLRRNHGDLQFSYEKGFLEICGVQPDTFKIINAFATNSFA